MLLLRLSLLNYDDDCLLSVLNVVSYFQKHQNKQWMDDIFVKWWRRPQKVYDFSTATMSRNRSWANGLCCRIDANGFRIESQCRFSFEMQYFFSTQYGQILILSFVVNASSCDAYYCSYKSICTYLHRHASQRITHKKKTSFVWFRTKRMATFKRQKTPTTTQNSFFFRFSCSFFFFRLIILTILWNTLRCTEADNIKIDWFIF